MRVFSSSRLTTDLGSRHAKRPASVADGQPGSLTRLQQIACARGNVFEALMEAVKHNSLGQISHALYAVGGEYRRNM